MRLNLSLLVSLALVACGPDGPAVPTVVPGNGTTHAGGGSGGAGGSGSGATGGSSASGGGVTNPGGGTSCSTDADCAAGEHCSGGELATCVADPVVDAGQPVVDAGQPVGDGGVTTPVDTSCESQTNPPTVFPPKWPTLPPTVPAGCRTGFEMNNPYSNLSGKLYTIHSKTPAGAAALQLELDFATYLQPDGLKITGTLGNGTKYVLYETCRMQTSTYGDPTDGMSRPPEDSIRDFRLDLQADTVQLDFDYARADSPTYAKITGLCDFNVTAPAGATNGGWWRTF